MAFLGFRKHETPFLDDPRFSFTRALHRLWTDHVLWTREYVIAAVDDLTWAQQAATRLLKNQEDIGNAIVSFYGPGAGAALADLLKQHITIAVDLVNAAKAGDDARYEEFNRAWTKNADEIAGLLSGANPYLARQDVSDLLGLHLSLTTEEVVARLQRDYLKDIEIFDQILTEILTLADALGEAIMKQFPEQFSAEKLAA